MTVRPLSTEIDLAREPGFMLGSARVRPSLREVSVDGARELLEPRVMQVLVALARRPGDVVSRDELMTSCWRGRVVGEDALNRCVGRLRQVEAQFGGFSVETIPKVGYRLVLPEPERGGDLTGPVLPAKTLAVLPFANLSPDPEQEYFSDGLSQELMSRLAKLAGLRVTGRTSSFAFKGRNQDLRAIGRQLGVEHILEGSVRRSGPRLRITAQLVACDDGYQQWSQTFDRDLHDVFAIQDEIAEAVAQALSIALGVGAALPNYGGTTTFEAYDRFLKAGRSWGNLGPRDAAARAEHLLHAVAIDPDYAMAWAALANNLTYRLSFATDNSHLLREERDAALDRALALAPDLSEAVVADGFRRGHNRDWEAAEATFRRALRSGPGHDPESEYVYGGFLTVTGRVWRGLPFRQAARDADPLSLSYATLLASSYLTLGLWDRFDAEYKRSLELPGQRSELELLRFERLIVTGADAAAIEAQLRRLSEWRLHPAIPDLIGQHSSAETSQAALRCFLDSGAGWQLFLLARLAAAYGDVELAIEALIRATPAAPGNFLQCFWLPQMGAVRADRRFKDVLKQTGLPKFWRAAGHWGDFARRSDEIDFEIVR